MAIKETPKYESMPTGKSLGNRYVVYADRIELRCRVPFFPERIVIRKDDLVSIDTYKPPVIRTSLLALKLDLADLNEHVGIKRKNGFFRQLRFTPDNPKEFVSKVKEVFCLSTSRAK
jgi:hypothetical protein